jgi:hypothetical protein
MEVAGLLSVVPGSLSVNMFHLPPCQVSLVGNFKLQSYGSL